MMKTYKKIDIYYAGDYVCSTNQSKTCKEAVKKFIERLQDNKHRLGGLSLTEKVMLNDTKNIKANFDHSRGEG